MSKTLRQLLGFQCLLCGAYFSQIMLTPPPLSLRTVWIHDSLLFLKNSRHTKHSSSCFTLKQAFCTGTRCWLYSPVSVSLWHGLLAERLASAIRLDAKWLSVLVIPEEDHRLKMVLTEHCANTEGVLWSLLLPKFASNLPSFIWPAHRLRQKHPTIN